VPLVCPQVPLVCPQVPLPVLQNQRLVPPYSIPPSCPLFLWMLRGLPCKARGGRRLEAGKTEVGGVGVGRAEKEALIVMEKGGGLQCNVVRGVAGQESWSSERAMNMNANNGPVSRLNLATSGLMSVLGNQARGQG
ncbi:hypothetical protein KUCAC02_009717, partial [Chaenocephalus aceratus]